MASASVPARRASSAYAAALAYVRVDRVGRTVEQGLRIEFVADVEHRHAIGPGAVEGRRQTFLEAEAVGDDQRCSAHAGGLRRGRLELVGIGAGRHEDLDIDRVAADSTDEVAQDGGGGDHRGPAIAGRPRGAAAGGGERDSQCREDDGGEKAQGGGAVGHGDPRLQWE
jgi:hypothetical protein